MHHKDGAFEGALCGFVPLCYLGDSEPRGRYDSREGGLRVCVCVFHLSVCGSPSTY